MEERRFTLKLLESEQMLYRIACAFLRSEADRRDAMQETALKAWQYTGTGYVKSSISGPGSQES